jgi:sugar (pentulose or hexulose) kinase
LWQGIDSSTQTCKVVIRDAESGALIREGRSSHPPGTEVDPQVWWIALQEAARAAAASTTWPQSRWAAAARDDLPR